MQRRLFSAIIPGQCREPVRHNYIYGKARSRKMLLKLNFRIINARPSKSVCPSVVHKVVHLPTRAIAIHENHECMVCCYEPSTLVEMYTGSWLLESAHLIRGCEAVFPGAN